MWLSYNIVIPAGSKLEGVVNLNNIDIIYKLPDNSRYGICIEKNDKIVCQYFFVFPKQRDQIFDAILEMIRGTKAYYKEENIMFEIMK